MEATEYVTVISSAPGGFAKYFAKVWRYRAVALAVARRDLRIRYSQTVLGILWAIIQPLTGLAIFTVFFGQLIKIDTGGIPYVLFVFPGMISWYFFSHIVYNAGNALVESQHLIRKVYFPKILLLFSKVMVGLVEFCISLILLMLYMLWSSHSMPVSIFALPLFILFTIAIGLCVSVWLSALTIRYRDFHHLIPYLVNFGIWLTPVFYPTTLLPSGFAWLMYLNPMAATIAGFRWSLTGGPPLDVYYLFSVLPVVGLLSGGLSYFKKIEDEISDYL